MKTLWAKTLRVDGAHAVLGVRSNVWVDLALETAEIDIEAHGTAASKMVKRKPASNCTSNTSTLKAHMRPVHARCTRTQQLHRDTCRVLTNSL